MSNEADTRLSTRLKIITILLALVLVVGAFFSWQRWQDSKRLIPSKVSKGLGFKLYYPTNLPAGYYVDRHSLTQTEKVLIFYIVTPIGKRIGVSEEALPADLPKQDTSKGPIKIPGEEDFSTGIGPAHIGLSGDKYLGDITTPTTWIVLNLTNFRPDDAKKITQSFTPL